MRRYYCELFYFHFAPLLPSHIKRIADPVNFCSSLAGLGKAKQALLEMVILPTKRRDLFTGLRRPARGSFFKLLHLNGQ